MSDPRTQNNCDPDNFYLLLCLNEFHQHLIPRFSIKETNVFVLFQVCKMDKFSTVKRPKLNLLLNTMSRDQYYSMTKACFFLLLDLHTYGTWAKV